jgi:hypothetical protein
MKRGVSGTDEDETTVAGLREEGAAAAELDLSVAYRKGSERNKWRRGEREEKELGFGDGLLAS